MAAPRGRRQDPIAATGPNFESLETFDRPSDSAASAVGTFSHKLTDTPCKVISFVTHTK